MKQNLFLSAVIFTVLHLCKAGPLRLHKRAAFYIANETACVVDNIVYSNGDPIPTDDPCEACRCRPPGFACVLKECRVKPGCRAVRQVGQCCPEYICGCEHNGRMYQDGEEIRDDKNPCYTCHCQGSSIACAFVDCFFRIDCIPEYVQGECCPRYTNCTRDLPDNNSFDENNSVPSLNLLPVLNDEYVVPVNEDPAPQEPASSEVTTNAPSQSSMVDDRNEETAAPEVKESTTLSSIPQTTVSESSESEESKLNPAVEENSTDEEASSNESTAAELSKDESEDKEVEETEKQVAVLNSETEIKKEENAETTTAKIEDPTDPTTEVVKEVAPQTTVTNDEEPTNDAEVTEKSPETESTSTEVPSSEKEVKNSAADNSKSLKLSDNENGTQEVPNVPEKGEETKTEEPEKTESESDETVTKSSLETSKIESLDTSESKPEPEENIAEESQNNPQAAIYSNDDKIKSESAETVTIVVHVKEKTKLTTETDFVSEQVTSESTANATQESLLKSNDELKSTEINAESAEVEKAASTSTNFEVFPSSTETSDKELTTSSPSTAGSLKEEAEGRSAETGTTSDSEENPTKDESTSDSKSEEVSSVPTTTQSEKDVTESTPAEGRADEDANNEAKENEPSVTVIKIEDPNTSVKIQITTDSETEVSKSEESTENVELTEGTKSEESVDEIQPEVREVDSKPEEKEQTTTSETTEKTTAGEKVESTSPVTEEIKPEERAAETESGDKENTANVESTKPEESQENKPAVTTESRNQATEESTQTEAPSNDNE